ncbi:MAG: DNA mismatch repair protein MutS [Anaerolineae bacterium]|nr:DNA mismatch repair protein MutS [Anaerolineae bacterium]MDW8098461.1 DNA mismatch repair protein MutS [Anaerolineae bacterium]
MTTPMRRQYLALKRQYPDVILFFRLGDFYETFDDDAKIVSEVCNVVLTSRPVGNDLRVPLAGVPYHAIETYVAKLLQAGYKVAIADQRGNEAVGGLVPREVSRVITPGTVVEASLLDERRNNYLAAVVLEPERAGLAYCDITTGEFAVTQIEDNEIARRVREELGRLQPAEVVLAEGGLADRERAWLPSGEPPPTISRYAAWHFDVETARQALLERLQVGSLAGFGCEGKPLAIIAAGVIVQYLADHQPDALRQIVGLRTYTTSEFMALDEATRRNLELTQTIRSGEGRSSSQGSLLGVLDHTRTPMGGRLLRRWLGQPLLDVARIERRLDAVEACVRAPLERAELRDVLRNLGDLERWTNRVVQRIAQPRDLVGIRQALARLPAIREIVQHLALNSDALMAIAKQLDTCEDVRALLERAIAAEPPATTGTLGIIRPGFSAELDDIQARIAHAREWVANLERMERERTGIKSLKVGYNKVFGYYIEVTNANRALVPAEYIRKQTLTNAERYITSELKEYESLILNAEERLLELETQIYRQVIEQVAAAAGRLLATAHAVAELDVYLTLAEVAVRHRYVRPTLSDDTRLDIIGGRHPVVELTRQEVRFVPNDTHLSPEECIVILTGPNMAGKSTYLRQVALIVLMAQIGSFVPAESAHIGLVDRIFTRIGAQDEIHAGQSTFMVEMVETANILHHATSRSLLILDEIGRGTSTYDGLAIAWAVVEYLHNHPRLRARTLFATHYHELTDLAERLPHVVNYHVAVAEEGDHIVFLYKIQRGAADRSYGVHVARLAGLPPAVVQRAEEILKDLEQSGAQGPRRAAAASSDPMVVRQLTLFSLSDPILDELKALDISTLTPLEALNKLYDLQQQARARP